MPLAMLEPADWPAWLGEVEANPASLLHPAPDETLRSWPVDRRVGSPRNNGPELLEPIALPGQAGPETIRQPAPAAASRAASPPASSSAQTPDSRRCSTRRSTVILAIASSAWWTRHRPSLWGCRVGLPREQDSRQAQTDTPATALGCSLTAGLGHRLLLKRRPQVLVARGCAMCNLTLCVRFTPRTQATPNYGGALGPDPNAPAFFPNLHGSPAGRTEQNFPLRLEAAARFSTRAPPAHLGRRRALRTALFGHSALHFEPEPIGASATGSTKRRTRLPPTAQCRRVAQTRCL